MDKYVTLGILLLGLLCNGVSGRLAKLDSSSCSYKGGQICNGAVTNRIGRTLVKICEDGVLKYKARYLVGEDFPLVGRDTGKGKDCQFYGSVFCDGDLIEDTDSWWLHMKCKDGEMFKSTIPWVEINNNSRIASIGNENEYKKHKRQQRKVSDTHDVYDEDHEHGYTDDNDNPGMKVVVNTNNGGSQVIITIESGRKEDNLKQVLRKNEFRVEDEMIKDYRDFRYQQNFEKQNLLKEVRDLLVSQKVEEEESESEFEFPDEKDSDLVLSEMIHDLNPILKRYNHISKHVNDNAETGFFGLLKTHSRVYPIVMGKAGKKMAQNTTIIQQHLNSPTRTKNLLLNDFERKINSKALLPKSRSSGRRKVMKLFQRYKDHHDAHQSIGSKEKEKTSEPRSFAFKLNGLPVFQNIKNNTRIPEKSKV